MPVNLYLKKASSVAHCWLRTRSYIISISVKNRFIRMYVKPGTQEIIFLDSWDIR